MIVWRPQKITKIIFNFDQTICLLKIIDICIKIYFDAQYLWEKFF